MMDKTFPQSLLSQRALTILQRLFELNPSAISDVFNREMHFNLEDVEDLPLVCQQVDSDPGLVSVSALGIINSVLESELTRLLDTDSGELIGFGALHRKKPLRVKKTGKADPYVVVALSELETLKRVLIERGINFSPESTAISLNGGPKEVVVNFEHDADMTEIQSVLNSFNKEFC